MKLFGGFSLFGQEVVWVPASLWPPVPWGAWMETGSPVAAVYSGDTMWMGGVGGLVMVTDFATDAAGRKMFKSTSGPSWFGEQSGVVESGTGEWKDEWLWNEGKVTGLPGQTRTVQVANAVFKSGFRGYLASVGFGWYMHRAAARVGPPSLPLVETSVGPLVLEVYVEGIPV